MQKSVYHRILLDSGDLGETQEERIELMRMMHHLCRCVLDTSNQEQYPRQELKLLPVFIAYLLQILRRRIILHRYEPSYDVGRVVSQRRHKLLRHLCNYSIPDAVHKIGVRRGGERRLCIRHGVGSGCSSFVEEELRRELRTEALQDALLPMILAGAF